MRWKHVLSGLSGILFSFNATAATNINTPTVSGTWTLANSPYYIHNDISLLATESLTIQPGVEVVFMGNYKFETLGAISAIGTPENKIVFRANDTTHWNDLSIPDGGWSGIIAQVSHFSPNIAMPAFEHCIFRDVKNSNAPVLNILSLTVKVDHCEFFKNYCSGVFVANYFGYNTISNIRFTNNEIHNNQAQRVMSTLFTDSTIVTGNKIYNNQSVFDIYTNSSYNDQTRNYFLFENNEVYNNHVSENAAILMTYSKGHSLIRNNKFHHNTTVLKGALCVASYTGIIENNLIANNDRTQKDGFFCGINDGGAGLQLLGDNVLFYTPDRYEFIVRNNIIANNYSDMYGAGIWVQHCKANIVNNTIVNNLSEDPGAAIHAWGQHCNVNVQNNIIKGNEVAETHGGYYDTGYNNFSFSPIMQNANVSHNLVDFTYSNAPSSVLGLTLNNYDTNIVFTNTTAGAGLNFDATLADFTPAATSLNIINKGNNSVPDHGTTDYLGNARIVDNIIDLGAIEYTKAIGTGITAAQLGEQFTLYPVPAARTIHLLNNSTKQILKAQVFGIDGRRQEISYRKEGTSWRFDLGDIVPGNYYMQLLLSDGQTVGKGFSVK